MKTSPNDVSNKEILSVLVQLQKGQEDLVDSVQELASHIDQRFEKVDSRMDKMEFRLNRVESLMVTKDYLDDKLADLKSHIRQDTAKQIQKALD